MKPGLRGTLGRKAEKHEYKKEVVKRRDERNRARRGPGGREGKGEARAVTGAEVSSGHVQGAPQDRAFLQGLLQSGPAYLRMGERDANHPRTNSSLGSP